MVIFFFISTVFFSYDSLHQSTYWIHGKCVTRREVSVDACAKRNEKWIHQAQHCSSLHWPLSGKEPQRQIGVGSMGTSGSLHGVIVSILSQNTRDVGFESHSRHTISHFHHTHDKLKRRRCSWTQTKWRSMETSRGGKVTEHHIKRSKSLCVYIGSLKPCIIACTLRERYRSQNCDNSGTTTTH